MGREGVRSAWRDVPASVRARRSTLRSGSPVVATTGVRGGFSPGPAVRADLADGRTVFVKAAGTALNPHAPALHRREGVVLGAAPPIGAGTATARGRRRRGLGRPRHRVDRWADAGRDRPRRRRRASSTCSGGWPRPRTASTSLASRRSPSPIAASAVTGSASSPSRCRASTRGVGDTSTGSPNWTHRRPRRRQAPTSCTSTPAPTTCCSLRRARRTTSSSTGRAPARGAPWIDLVGLLPALHLDGGPPPAAVFDTHPLGRAADRAAVDAYLAAITGYLTRQALLPAATGTPDRARVPSGPGRDRADVAGRPPGRPVGVERPLSRRPAGRPPRQGPPDAGGGAPDAGRGRPAPVWRSCRGR